MKNILRSILFSLCLSAAVAASAGGMPSVSVMVTDSSGHVAYKGRTRADGTFATDKLKPGEYVVQFNSGNMPSGNYALVISAGKQKVMAEAVPSQKFGKGGVAMRVSVGKDLNISGQLSSGKAAGKAAAADNTRIKIINGKKYIWVAGGTGSNLGGRWVEEGTADALNVQRVSPDSVQELSGRR